MTEVATSKERVNSWKVHMPGPVVQQVVRLIFYPGAMSLIHPHPILPWRLFLIFFSITHWAKIKKYFLSVTSHLIAALFAN